MGKEGRNSVNLTTDESEIVSSLFTPFHDRSCHTTYPITLDFYHHLVIIACIVRISHHATLSCGTSTF